METGTNRLLGSGLRWRQIGSYTIDPFSIIMEPALGVFQARRALFIFGPNEASYVDPCSRPTSAGCENLNT